MIEKDYILRLIQTFFDAINEIVNKIDKEDMYGAKIQIDETYKLLGKSADFFHSREVNEIVDFLKGKDGDYLKSLELLAQLIFLDAKTEHQTEIQNKLLKKAKLLFEHYNMFSEEFSFEANSKLMEINKLLIKSNS